MSSYPNPSSNLSIYNNINYTWSNKNITYLIGDKRYLKLYGNSKITGNLTITGELTNNTYVSALANITSLQNSTASNTSVSALQAGNLTNSNNITALQNGNIASNIAITVLQNTTAFITASQATGNTTISGNVILSGNLAVASSYFSVANNAVMIGTINPTATGASCPLLVQSNPTSSNPWLNGIVCYGNLTANAVITASVQNSGLNCWFALANRFGNSWVIANDNGTNSGNPLRWQASQDFSNVNANMMSLSRTGNLWVRTAIGIGNATPVAPLYVTAGGSGTDPATNGILVANMTNSTGQNAIITCRTGGASAGSPMVSLDVFNVAGWSILNSNLLSNSLNFNAAWDGSGTNHMTILRSNGNVGIASTNPAHKLALYGTMGVFPTGSSGTERMRFYSDATGTADIIQIRQTIGSSATYWYYNGNNVAGTVSDRRVKCNISDLCIDESVAFIKKLKPRKFNYLSNPDGDIQVGFIAQEVLESCVNQEQKSTIANYESYCDDNPDCPSIGLNQTQLQPMMIHTIQSLLDKVESLEKRTTQLEDTNARLNSIFGGHYSY